MEINMSKKKSEEIVEEVVVQDVINMAGGLTKKADTSFINLAEVVENHSSITIGKQLDFIFSRLSLKS